VTFGVGIDGIEISRHSNRLYYTTMSHSQMFKVPMAALLQGTLSAQALSKKIVAVGRNPLSDGITVDAQDNILITNVENGGIARITQEAS
jgi:sugar lactone lactonase YvrE